MKVYLEDPVELYGIEVRHTYDGLIFLIDHYSHIRANARPEQMDMKARQHCTWLIENLTVHKALYEKQFETKPIK
jgi:hypothetical protein